MTKFIEIPASSKSLSMRRPVHGVGINDSKYQVKMTVGGKKITCHYYQTWTDMLKRCYSLKLHQRRPTYIGCEVCSEWLSFSAFKSWMENQDWKGKEIDKDILNTGSKTYSPKNCIFISSRINNLMNKNEAQRGDYPQGVNFEKDCGKYRAQCSVSGKKKMLGKFNSAKQAEKVYLIFKSDLIERIANEEEASENPRLQQALLRHAKAFKEKAEKL